MKDNNLIIRSLSGKSALPYLDELARLRIEVFYEWPYLYEGNMDYEIEYLNTFMRAADSLMVVAFDGDQVIGASTAMPLRCETDNIQAPWREAGYDVDRVFYYSESVLRRDYRGRGLGVRFFEEREAYARQLGKYDLLTFCGVVRPEDHPKRPPNHQPLDDFWRRRGFQPTELLCYISWLDRGETAQTAKPLRFWTKTLG